MSVSSVLPRVNSFNGFQPTIANQNNSTFNSEFWETRKTQNDFSGMTSAEVKRLSSRLLGVGAAGAGVALMTCAVLGVVSWPVSLLTIPCALGSIGAFWYSFQFDDYENPEELAKFRDEAAALSLDQVMRIHGWDTVFRWGIITSEQFTDKYRQQTKGKNLLEIINMHESTLRHLSQCQYHRFDYQVPSPSECRSQWRKETAVKSFEEIIQSYPLDKLEKYNLLEAGELHQISALKRDYDGLKANYDRQISQLEREFQNNTQEHRRSYESECARADQAYHDNWAVRRLHSFHLGYTRERQAVHELANRHKNEARERFNRAVATITNHGQIPENELPPTAKLFYDQQNNELLVSLHRIENEANLQLANIDSRCIGERGHLNSEENRAKAERNRLTAEAKGRYDTAVASHLQRKEQQNEPILQAFRSAANDVNSRYRAYLRTIGITV